MLHNAGGGGGNQLFREKALRRCKVQCYWCYEGVGGGPISRKKKRYVTRPAKSPGISGSLQKWGVISRSPGIVKKTPGIEGNFCARNANFCRI